MSFLDKCSISGQVMLIGLVVVFVALVIIIAMISILSKLIGEKAQKAQESAPVPAPIIERVPAPILDEGVSPEIVAAISAAIACMSGNAKGLVIRSIKKKNAWSRAARAENR